MNTPRKSVRIQIYSDLYFLTFRLHIERYGVSLCIQSKCPKIRITFDEGVMIGWLQNDEDSYFNNPPTPDSDGKLLFVEIHRGQQILKIKRIFKNMKTQLGNISGDLTSYVQVLDVVVNKLFKSYVRRLYEKHVEENLESVKKVLQKDKH